MDRTSVIYAFTLRYTVMELMFLLLINVMITSTSDKLRKYFLFANFIFLIEIGSILFLSSYKLTVSLSSLIDLYCFVVGLLVYLRKVDSWKVHKKVQDLSSIRN